MNKHSEGDTSSPVLLDQGSVLWRVTLNRPGVINDLERIADLSDSLRQCSTATELCNHVFSELRERSPTALALTLKLLRRNQGRDMREVFRTDLRAAELMLSHPDFLEGVRARVLDKDQQPRWRPSSIEDADLAGLDLEGPSRAD